MFYLKAIGFGFVISVTVNGAAYALYTLLA